MAFLNKENQTIGQPDELNVFSCIPNQVAVEKAFFTESRPISSLSNEQSPIEFFSSGQSALYTDLRRTRLYLKCSILHQDDTPLTDKEKVGIINLPLQTMWSQIDIYLNGKLVSCQTCNFPYKSYIKCILSTSTGVLSHEYRSQMYYKDDNPGENACDPYLTANFGLYTRALKIKESREFELEGQILEDVFQLRKYLINGVDIYMKLYRNNSSFVIMSDENNIQYKIKINDAILKCMRVKVDPGVIVAHSKILENKVARYQFLKSEVKTHVIARDSSSMVWDNVWPNATPRVIVLGLVESASLNGDLKKNPLYFDHFNCTEVGVYINGESFPHRPYKLDFSKGLYSSAFQGMFTIYSSTETKNELSIDNEDFAHGYALYAFSLEPVYFDQEHVNLVKQANIRIEIRFATPLTEAVTCVAFAEFNAEINIDKTRDVHLIQP